MGILWLGLPLKAVGSGLATPAADSKERSRADGQSPLTAAATMPTTASRRFERQPISNHPDVIPTQTNLCTPAPPAVASSDLQHANDDGVASGTSTLALNQSACDLIPNLIRDPGADCNSHAEPNPILTNCDPDPEPDPESNPDLTPTPTDGLATGCHRLDCGAGHALCRQGRPGTLHDMT